MHAPAVEILDLVKRYGDRVAVNGVSWCAEAGQLLALLGTNGAGKTSTIEICEGYRTADSGTVRVLGLDPRTQAAQLRPQVGVMLQDGVGGYTSARAGELLQLFASYCAHPLPVGELLERVGLTARATTLVKRLSGGEKQRLSLAMALVSRPSLVFLDEPTTGMDPQARRMTWELIRTLRSDGVSIVLTTHYLDEAEALADQVVVMHHGDVVGRGTPEELTRAGSSGTVRFSARADLDLVSLGTALGPQSTVTIESRLPTGQAGYLIEAPITPPLLVAITAWCADRDVLAEGLTVGRRSLEEVFLALTDGTGSDGSGSDAAAPALRPEPPVSSGAVR